MLMIQSGHIEDLVNLPQATPKIPGGEWLSSK
jgi:hypothetical protein